MIFYIDTVIHEVHKENYSWKPTVNLSCLGVFDYLSQAVAAAKKAGYSNADGCAYYCPEMHTK